MKHIKADKSTPDMTLAIFLGHQTVGDYLGCHLSAASIAREFPGCKLVGIYRDDRPYKKHLNMLNPYVTEYITLPPEASVVAPLDWFNGEGGFPGGRLGEELIAKGLHKPDLFLSPIMAYLRNVILPFPKFRFPDENVPEMTSLLKHSGVDPNKWMVTIHIREPNFFWRKRDVHKNPDLSEELKKAALVRDFDLMTYLPMITHIIEKQGGQVVRIGDPSMTPLPKMKGFVDLALQKDSFLAQLFAVSRSRYFVGTPSGPVMFACAMKVPAAMTNGFSVGVWNPGDVLLLKKIILPDGYCPTPLEIAGVIGELPGWFGGVEWEDNAPEDFIAVADHLYEATDDCTQWREEWPEEPYQPSGKVTLPLPRHDFTKLPGIVWFNDILSS